MGGSLLAYVGLGSGVSVRPQRASEQGSSRDRYRVPVASLDDLIAMKGAAGRRKDLLVVEELAALRDVIDEQR
jgi:hypothetical protein